MEISAGALRNLWNRSSKKQRMLAALFLIGILATGMLLIFTDSPESRSAGGQGQVTAEPAEGGALFSASVNDPMGSSLYYAGVFFKMIAVLLLIIGGAVVLRRWQAKRGVMLGRQMQLVESVRLSPKQALHLVKVGDRCVLIGATDQNISMLSEIDGEAATELVQVSGPVKTSFSDLLQAAANVKGGQA